MWRKSSKGFPLSCHQDFLLYFRLSCIPTSIYKQYSFSVLLRPGGSGGWYLVCMSCVEPASHFGENVSVTVDTRLTRVKRFWVLFEWNFTLRRKNWKCLILGQYGLHSLRRLLIVKLLVHIRSCRINAKVPSSLIIDKGPKWKLLLTGNYFPNVPDTRSQRRTF